MKRRVDVAVQQVAVWQAAAEATAQLKAAQEQRAAQAARHSQKVTPHPTDAQFPSYEDAFPSSALRKTTQGAFGAACCC